MRARFVLDASVALSWALLGRPRPDLVAVMDRLVEEIAVVPAFWRLEIAMRNGLPIATLDKAMIAAARSCQVETLPG